MDKDKLMKELIMDEGYKYEIYLDHLGYPTMGVGHLITAKDEEHGQEVGTPVSEERIRECLDQDIDIVCSELDRNESWWRNLDDNRQRIMANMCFNLGYPRLSGFKRFRAAGTGGAAAPKVSPIVCLIVSLIGVTASLVCSKIFPASFPKSCCPVIFTSA